MGNDTVFLNLDTSARRNYEDRAQHATGSAGMVVQGRDGVEHPPTCGLADVRPIGEHLGNGSSADTRQSRNVNNSRHAFSSLSAR